MPSRIRFASVDGQHLNFFELRKAFLSFLIAKKTRGKFVFRLDNVCDKKPFDNRQALEALDDLIWLGLFPDESPLNADLSLAPYVQNERFDIYNRYAQTLFDLGLAYKRIPPKEKNAPNSNTRPALYLKIAGISDGFTDLVLGKIASNRLNLNDWIIIDADGLPSPDFASIIDDHMMNISHVIIDENQLPTTAKYLSLCRALNWKTPAFVHLPDVKFENLEIDEKFIVLFQREGYLPEAVCSYLYELEIHEYEKEHFETISEIISDFDIKKIHRNKRVYNLAALHKINATMIKKMSDVAFNAFIRPFIASFISETYSDEYLLKLALLCKTQISNGSEICDYFAPFLMDRPSFSPAELQLINSPQSKAVIQGLKNHISEMDDSLKSINQTLLAIQETTGLTGRAFYLPIRLLLTRLSQGAEIDEIIRFLGKEEVLRRLNQDKD